MIKYRIRLTGAERSELLDRVSKGKGRAVDIRRAHVLLASDESLKRESETSISEVYHLCTRSVERIRRQFCERGMDSFLPLERKERSDKRIDGTIEAHLVAVSCSEPPAGRSHWTLQAIADRVVELGVIDHISHTSVGTVLKKMRSSHGKLKAG